MDSIYKKLIMALETVQTLTQNWVETTELPDLEEAIWNIINGHPTDFETAILESTIQALRSAKDHVDTTSDARWEIDKLIDALNDSIETVWPTEYSMEYLKENTDGFLGKLLDIKIMWSIWAVDAFMLSQKSEKIWSELLELMNPAAHENLEILAWNSVVSWISFSSALSFWAQSAFEWFTNIFRSSEENDEWDENKWLSLDSFTEIVDSVQNFDVDNSDENGSIKIPAEFASLNNGSRDVIVPSGIEKWFEYLESLTDWLFQNMTLLLELWKEKWVQDSPNFQNLLSHPLILQEILENGFYKADGFDINIKTQKLVFTDIPQEEINTAWETVMEEVLSSTNSLSWSIDGLLSQTEKFATLFDKLGIDVNALKESLFKIPVFWFIFKILFWDFLDTIESRMEILNASPLAIKAVKNFTSFIWDSDNHDKLPFNPNIDESWNHKIESIELEQVRGFIKKIESRLAWTSNEEKALKISILWDSKLAEKLLTWEHINDSEWIMIILRESIANLSWMNKPSQKDFFVALSKIDIPELHQTISDDWEPSGANLSETIISPIITQVEEATSFPITLPDGRDVSYDTTNSTLKIWDESFTLKKMGENEILSEDITKMKPNFVIEGDEVIIKSEGFGMELGRITKTQLWELIEELATNWVGTLTHTPEWGEEIQIEFGPIIIEE